ncbi:MAG: cell division protein FtsQ/DivIB [Gammaproteobacteria bacterium]|nr:cell division protein FtsQ/DivIB [Gammaproteobacteria bacterium]
MKRRRQRTRAWKGLWRHQNLRRGLAGFAGLAVVFAAYTLWGSVALMERTRFPFKVLRVEGSFAHVTAPELSAIVAPYAAAGFFETDVKVIKQALEELPWVERASVRRMWPDVLQVTVTEERAVARWQEGGLVNPAGQVFHPAELDAEAAKLPLLAGPTRTSAQVMGAYVRMSEPLASQGIAITSLSMDARRSWRLTLDNGMRLTLGRKDSERQLERFARFYPGGLAGRVADVEEVDLRYTNGFAVKWRLTGSDAARRPVAKNTGDKA